MRTRTPIVALVLALLVLASCAHLRPDADPVLVRAEQALTVSFETVDALLRLEHDNQAAMTALVPGAHQVAEDIRVKGPASFRALEAAISAYRANRTPDNKASLLTWLAVCEQLAHDAQILLAAWGGGR